MPNEFGSRLRALREDADLNQSQLASAVNMAQRKISYMECGRFEPSLDDILAFCAFFCVSSDYLLGLTNNPSPKK